METFHERETPAWRGVDEGWGRRAVDFATLSEPANCREYVALHQRLGVDASDRLLDVACGAGLAVELAQARGARCSGIDASPRLITVARDRCPDADLHVGDMHDLPWPDSSFEVVTSFRGIWGTTPDALAEVHRVLVPGGRLGLTVWGHIKRSPGAWALAPLALASPPKVQNQAAMVALGRPGAGEELLARMGFVDIERVDIPFAWEFADPEAFPRALGSTGPAFEVIQAIGEDGFARAAIASARERIRDGLPLRAVIDVVGYVARKPSSDALGHSVATMTAERPNGAGDDGGNDDGDEDAGFLEVPEPSPDVQRLYDADVDQRGYVMNLSRMWAHRPTAKEGLFELLADLARAGSLSVRQRSVLIAAAASTIRDSYCSVAWGTRLAEEAGAGLAGDVLRGVDGGLDPSERALAGWARQVARDPNATTAADVQALRDAGFDDGQIFAITAFVALRTAFSIVNDALGARPDRPLVGGAPAAVRDAVTYGR